MATRLIEALLAASRAGDLRQVLDDLELRALSDEPLADGRLRVRFLVDAERSGAVVDSVQRAVGAGEPFDLLILPVEAALPRPADEPPEPPAEKRAPIGSRAVSREELYQDVVDMSRRSPVFFATVVLSTLVAAVGLLRDNVAVVIGAMVIAPLLGPNVAFALGTTLADGALIRRSLATNLAGMAVALGLAVAIGVILTVDPSIRSIEERTAVHLSDIVLALAAGSAGTLALTTGVPVTLVGVMVAVALLPPTVALGLMVGEGRWALAGGATLLLLANVICINLAGVLTFLIQGVRPLTWWGAARARRATRLAIAIWVVLLLALVAVILVAEERTDDADVFRDVVPAPAR